MERSLLARTAALMSKDDSTRTTTLEELRTALDPINLQTNKTRSQAVLDNKAVMDVLLNLAATTRSVIVAWNALWVFVLLGRDLDNAKRRFKEHPSLVPVAMRKLELGAENATEHVQIMALYLLQGLALVVDDAREMATKNPKLVSLLMNMAGSKSEQAQVLSLGVLRRFASNSETRREMVTMNPTLIPLIVAQVESKAEQVRVEAWGVLQTLPVNVDNGREMVSKKSKVIPMLMTNTESKSEQAQVNAWGMLSNLVLHTNNAAEMMVAHSAVLLPLLVAKMNGVDAFPATRVVYHLSCSPANRAVLRANNLVVAALTKGTKDQNDLVSFFSFLALVNLFGAEENSKVLKTNLAMLQRIFKLIASALKNDEWRLNIPLLAFRFLCVVQQNRQLLWNEYGSQLPTSVLAALQRAIADKDTPAVENAVSTLAPFCNDPKPLVWMRSNKPQLDRVFAQLAPFPEALKMAQVLLQVVAPSPKQPLPQNEVEIRQWLSKHAHGEEIADRLVKEDLVEDLKAMSGLTPSELVTVINFNAKQAHSLHAALKELF